jgi:hypothetical protein
MHTGGCFQVQKILAFRHTLLLVGRLSLNLLFFQLFFWLYVSGMAV